MRVQNIRKSFPGGVCAVRGVDLELPQARVVVLLGPNGSGKSTLLNCLGGAIRPDEGILVDGQRESQDLRTAGRGLRRGIACAYQTARVFPRLTTMENCLMTVPNWGHDTMWVRKQRSNGLELRIRETLETFGIESYAFTVAGELSTGCVRRLEFARLQTACDFGVRLCLLDEPSAGLDPDGLILLRDLLVRLCQRGLHVLMVEHNLEVAGWADDAYLLVEGEVVDHAVPRLLLHDHNFRTAMLQGLAAG